MLEITYVVEYKTGDTRPFSLRNAAIRQDYPTDTRAKNFEELADALLSKFEQEKTYKLEFQAEARRELGPTAVGVLERIANLRNSLSYRQNSDRGRVSTY